MMPGRVDLSPPQRGLVPSDCTHNIVVVSAVSLAGAFGTGAGTPTGQGPTTVSSSTFWSIECRPSERARPALNLLATRLRGRPFRWVALARESDTSGVQRYLAEHPMTGTVALHDSATWAAYSPEIATPLFYVIDARGYVRLRALGTSAVDLVAAEVRHLLGPVGDRPVPH